jgi:chemotaxis methyl-accepting protein methylase
MEKADSRTDLTHIRFEGKATQRTMTSRQWPPGDASQPRRRPATRHQPVIEGLPAHVLASHGLNPAFYRNRPLERRVSACLRALSVNSEPAAIDRFNADPASRSIAFNTLLIGVSAFFRDRAVFEMMRTTVIQALSTLERPPRVWSAGCSSGAEVYSAAIMLAEAGLLEGAQILGTDCRPDAIAAARLGVFEHDAMAGVEPAMRDRYFERTHAGWRVVPAIRKWTTWEVADATCRRPDGRWDLVLCRNVVIYLREGAGDALLSTVAGCLAPGGFLIVGKAERAPGVPGLRPLGTCIYRNDVDD